MNNSMRDDDMNEQKLADQTVDLLESTAIPADHDEVTTAELGQLLRQAATHDLPPSNVDLREMLLAETGSASTSDAVRLANSFSGPDSRSPRNTSNWLKRATFAAVAASALCALGVWVFSDSTALVPSVAQQEPTEPAGQDQPKVVYKTETHTRPGPVTKSRTETRSRVVPVIRYREESREVKLANGSVEKQKVRVPYTENVQQNYTVQVPFTENATQNYSVEVPYTADGRRIEVAEYGKYGIELSDKGMGLGARIAGLQGQRSERDRTLAETQAALRNEKKRNATKEEALRSRAFSSETTMDDLAAVAGAQGKEGQQGQQGEQQLAEASPMPAASILGGAGFGVDGKAGEPTDASGVFTETSPHSGVLATLPALKPTAENTVVDVPDGGTVLLGGIKKSRLAAKSARSAGELNGRLGLKDSGKQLASDGSTTRGVSGQPRPNRTMAVLGKGQRTNLKMPAKPDDITERVGGGRGFVGGGGFGYFGSELEGKQQSGEQYAPIHENNFLQTVGSAAVSTFSIDVDTASYSNMRRFLNGGQRPPANSIRIEELVNYFRYDYPQPTGDDPFSVNMEVARCPWNDTHQLLRVGLKGKDIDANERPATNVVYLLDVSGSMQNADKLPLLKSGFKMLTKQLTENDRVSIVTYAGEAGVALEPTSGNETRKIIEAIERLSAGGSTHGSAGIELAYKLAQQHFIKGGVNKVILATDGDLNVGVTSDDALVRMIKQKASEGVFLTVLGFGTGNIKDAKLEQVADNGNGHYAYIDNTREAHRVLVEQMSGSLVTIAKDVKIQIEFNPVEVKSYRLIGYENRVLAAADFDNDRKDAGEIGAGHTVTAIYEIEPAKAVAQTLSIPKGMKYQQSPAQEPASKPVRETTAATRLSDAADSGELATLALRYKLPEENESKRIEFAIKNEDRSFTGASDDFRFAASVAGFGMWLRGSKHAGDANPLMMLEIATEAIGDDKSGYRSEFVDLIRKACR